MWDTITAYIGPNVAATLGARSYREKVILTLDLFLLFCLYYVVSRSNTS